MVTNVIMYPSISLKKGHRGKNFIMTEKIHGSNIGIGFVNGCLQVQSRRRVLDINDTEAMKLGGLSKIIHRLIEKVHEIRSILEGNDNFMVYGEIFGDASFKIMEYDDSEASEKAFGCNTVFFRAFDICDLRENFFWKYSDAVKTFEQVGMPCVPILKYLKEDDDKYWADLSKLVEEYGSAYSKLKVEGFVIKKDESESRFKRQIFKVKRKQFQTPNSGKSKKGVVSFDDEIEKFVDENRFASACSKVGKDNLEEIKKEMIEDVMRDFMSVLTDRVTKRIEKYLKNNAENLCKL